MPPPTSLNVASASPGSAPGAPVRAAAPRRLLLTLTWCALALALVASGAAGYMLFAPKPAADAGHPAPVHVVRVGTLVVNIAATDGRRYLRATIELAAATSRDGRRLEEHRTPIVDTAIAVLGAMPLEELLDHGKRDGLKTALRERLNTLVGGDPIAHVFFTEFVIQ